MRKINAVFDMVIVKVLKEIENTTKGGIVLPTSITSLPQGYGIVSSVAPEIECIKEGDTITFHSRAGQVILLDNEEYRCMHAGEVYGVLAPE